MFRRCNAGCLCFLAGHPGGSPIDRVPRLVNDRATRPGHMSIRIDNLTKSFAGVVAVSNLSLSVADGEMLVLLGPSGCGKTTTMRCIAGLERPESGAIAIAGRIVFAADKLNVPINQRNVGMVFQSYAIWPHMS